jgi:hypothetical protein
VANHDGPADSLVISPAVLEAVVRAVMAGLASRQPARAEDAADFLTARQFGDRLGLSHETVRQLAIAGELPHTVVHRGKQIRRRYPRAYADAFAASGMDVADLTEFTARWRASTAVGQDGPAPAAAGGAA